MAAMIANADGDHVSYDVHGYQPVYVDEDWLSDEEHAEAEEWAEHNPRDWTQYLTAAELRSYECSVDRLRRRHQAWFGRGELPAVVERFFEMNRLGILRAYAQHKYAAGGNIYCGDVRIRRKVGS